VVTDVKIVLTFLVTKKETQLYLLKMANGVTYGINFPFRESVKGDYVSLSQNPDEEIRSNLIHLILTRKGSRYYLPDFGTKIFEFIFEPLDGITFEALKDDIRDNVAKYIPNLIVNDIIILPYNEYESEGTLNTENLGGGVYRVAGRGTEEYTAKMRIDYTISDNTFQSRDFVIINI
jgi:phage baseplate assembly protein W